jgi:hypothetical protein
VNGFEKEVDMRLAGLMMGGATTLILAGSSLASSAELTAPERICPADQTKFTIAAHPVQTLYFTWLPSGARSASYHLVIARTPGFEKRVVDRTTSRTSERVRGLEPGSYFWKITALDASGTETSSPPGWTFSLEYARDSASAP